MEDDPLKPAMDTALRYLSHRGRTVQEVRRRLQRAEFSADLIEQVIDRLQSSGLLDDAAYSQRWVVGRHSSKHLGASRLAMELRQRGVDPETVGEAIQAVTPETDFEAAMAAASKRWAILRVNSPEETRKLAAFLQRRGFGWDTIKKVIVQLESNFPS